MTKPSRLSAIATHFFLTWLVIANVQIRVSGEDWTQFLGPHRNGISSETGLLDKWPDGGPKEVSRTAGGVGMSGLAVSGDRAVTLIQTDGQQRLVALNSQTGKPLWQTTLAPEYKNN